MNTHTLPKQKASSVLSLQTLGICVALISIALVAMTVFKVPIDTLFLAGILLACPLLHIWMMKDGNHKH